MIVIHNFNIQHHNPEDCDLNVLILMIWNEISVNCLGLEIKRPTSDVCVCVSCGLSTAIAIFRIRQLNVSTDLKFMFPASPSSCKPSSITDSFKVAEIFLNVVLFSNTLSTLEQKNMNELYENLLFLSSRIRKINACTGLKIFFPASALPSPYPSSYTSMVSSKTYQHPFYLHGLSISSCITEYKFLK